jgi:DNA-binding protein YbaB
MKGGIGQLMKQAQEMQANMKKAQEEMGPSHDDLPAPGPVGRD